MTENDNEVRAHTDSISFICTRNGVGQPNANVDPEDTYRNSDTMMRGCFGLPEHQQEAQGLGALLDMMEDNDHINWITQRSRCIFHSKTCHFRDTRFWKIRTTPNDPRMTLST